MSESRYARVAVDSSVQALDRPFDYEIPERMLGRVNVGSIVRIVLHGRNMRGFVTELVAEAAVSKARPLSSLVSQVPVFDEQTIALARWTARRYVVPLGRVLHDAVPGRFSAPTGAAAAEPTAGTAPALRAEIARAVDASETTCVVIDAREEDDVIAALVGRVGRALVICPRVDVAERLGARIASSAVLHGDDRPADRAAAWAAARDGKVNVLVGGRSALFTPMPDLSLVVVAGAHDRSLKSERAPRLHAVFVARERARLAGVRFVATGPAPPVELAHEIGCVEPRRASVRPQVVRPRSGPVTPQLIEVLRSTVAGGRDALVFAGRKGDVLRTRCVDCGWVPSCDRCGRGLVPETGSGRSVCRVCGETSPIPEECPSCSGNLSGRGWGHERIAREIERADVGAPVVRIVAGDVPQRPSPAVIVGTLAAVHAVSDAGVVCVADLDQLLGRPDFRASELALQTLHECATSLAPGGKFLLQTREIEHHVVQSFTRASYRFFFERELSFREETAYPPFGVVVRLDLAADDVRELDETLTPVGGRVLGALPRKDRMTALVRAPALEPLLDPLRTFVAAHPHARVDVDPVELS